MKISDNRKAELDTMLRGVCDAYNESESPFFPVKPEDVLGKRRFIEIATCRHLYRFAISNKYTTTLQFIGKLTGCDHATVINSLKVAMRILHGDPDLAHNLKRNIPEIGFAIDEVVLMNTKDLPTPHVPKSRKETKEQRAKRIEKQKNYRIAHPEGVKRRNEKQRNMARLTKLETQLEFEQEKVLDYKDRVSELKSEIERLKKNPSGFPLGINRG